MRICLVGATHSCHNPRLLREADTLAEQGHEVRVVAPCFMADLHEKDERHLARRKWRLERVDFRPVGWQGKSRSIYMRGRRRLSHELFQRTGLERLAEYGYTTGLPELTALASREQADWFIAHAHPALPVAAAAAHRWNARLGFDCEDLLAEHVNEPVEIVRLIEKEYLPKCDYVSVPSQCLLNLLSREYSISSPLVLYNVFPLELADGLLAPAKRPANPKLRLHWFSKTIGEGRGIEETIEAISSLGSRVELHLRGQWANGYEAVISALASRCQVTVKSYSLVDHDDLIKTMDQFDVGLALERPENTNYSVAITNKIGSYLLAGLAIAATDTPGQREVLAQIPRAGFLYQAGQPQQLTEGLRRWLDDHDALRAAQQAAWDAARERFCWDIEQKKFLAAIESKAAKDISAQKAYAG